MRIKDWHKFQHFKDRKPPWIKLYRDILDDLEWHDLDDKAAKVLVMLWVIASEDDGNIPDMKKLAFRLRMRESDVINCCSKLSHWLIQDDINVISERYQHDALERETEVETKKEKETEPPRKRSAPTQKTKAIKTQMPEGFGISERVAAWAKERGFDQLDEHMDAFKRKASAKAYSYANWDDAFMEAVREDWAKIRGQRQNTSFAQQAADVARSTVPSRVDRDPALVEMERHSANAAPIPEAIRQKLAALKGGALL